MSADFRLPDVQQAVLDAATLDALFSDLAQCAEVLSVVLKTSRGPVAEASVSLAAGRAALEEGTARGVQIRYRHEGTEWCDTLLRTPAGVRLVRVNSDDAQSSAG